MKEIWKTIEGFEGRYQVSNLGNIKSLKYRKERILSPVTYRNGYLFVELCKNGYVKKFLVHRLVAEAFIPNPENLPQVNHKNEIKTDNTVQNLEWCDNRYNQRYSSAKKIGCFQDNKLIKVYDAVRDVEKDGFYHSNVCNALKGKLKSSGGYHWQYLD